VLIGLLIKSNPKYKNKEGSKMGNYKQYPLGTKVRIKATGQTGEAFESSCLGLISFISVWIDGEEIDKGHKARIFINDDVEFI